MVVVASITCWAAFWILALTRLSGSLNPNAVADFMTPTACGLRDDGPPIRATTAQVTLRRDRRQFQHRNVLAKACWRLSKTATR
jgi:hypothetical protein